MGTPSSLGQAEPWGEPGHRVGPWPGLAPGLAHPPRHAAAYQEVDGGGLGAVGTLTPLKLVLQAQQEGAGIPGRQRQEVDVGGQLPPQCRELWGEGEGGGAT